MPLREDFSYNRLKASSVKDIDKSLFYRFYLEITGARLFLGSGSLDLGSSGSVGIYGLCFITFLTPVPEKTLLSLPLAS